jgi:hypothetical protein
LRQQRDQLVELLAAADEVAHRHGHRPRSPVLFTAGSSRLREEPLAQQQSEVGGKQVLELVSGPERLVRDVATARMTSSIVTSRGSRSGAGAFRYTRRAIPEACRSSSSSPETSIPGATQPYRCQYSPTKMWLCRR